MAIFTTFIWLIWILLFDTCTAEMFVCSSMPDACYNGNDDKKNTNARVRALEEKVSQLQNLVQSGSASAVSTINGIPRDCEEIYESGVRTDGIHAISPDGRCPFFVYCDMTNGGWTLIQRRINGSVNFYWPWVEYVQGFGDIDGENWLGLQKIHRLTAQGSQIYFDMALWDDKKEYAHYKVFTVLGATTAFKMNVDAFGYDGSINELLSYHDNMKFSTFDRDNDEHESNCCKDRDGGGWWYKGCYKLGNPNGIYGKREERGGISYWDTKLIPVKTVIIKVKPIKGSCIIDKKH